MLTPDLAHAASKQAHSPQKANAVGSQNDCDAEETDDLVIVTDFGWDVDCFHGVGTMSVRLYDVYSLQTGLYITTFTWKDYNGDYHTTTKPEETFLAAGDAASNAFGGYGSMEEITSIEISPYTTNHQISCDDQGMGVRFATNALNSNNYYVDCFSTEGTFPVGLYGVYTLYTGDFDVTFYWRDYDGGQHVSIKSPHSMLAAGNAAENGFAGSYSMALVTKITLSLPSSL